MSNFATVEALAAHLRQELESKKYLLLFAYNGTGKTRLSMAFKNIGKKPAQVIDCGSVADPVTTTIDYGSVSSPVDEVIDYGNVVGDTLYFNAFTEDLFSWDNDLDGDSDRFLKLNNRSQFFSGLEDLEMETRIRRILNRYADFDFTIKYEFDESVKKQKMSEVRFSRETPDGDSTKLSENIKVSRGEENLFIWCFFLAIVELAMDKEIEAYSWVKYVYIDDPISSLDENNAVSVAHHLAQLLKDNKSPLKAIISSHHALFFNVLCNEFHRVKGVKHHFLSRSKVTDTYSLKDTGDTPFFYHVAMLAELHKAAQSGSLYTYHFSMLRIILEKTASFHGYKGFAHCIQKAEDDPEGVLHTRLINILNHGNYSHYEPQEMLQENKDIFRKILRDFMQNYKFNTEVFPELVDTQQEAAA